MEYMTHSSENIFETQVRVQDEYGIHARPAALLAQTAQNFNAEISLSWQGRAVDVKSILDILSLAAPHQAELTLMCRGADAHEAGQALAEFFQPSKTMDY